ncbi:hypothetical protein RAB80_017576 [Fusarium oxysporum f. sp. vasinfectum]|uniref:Rhodopsin domain-containing protein n=1 Tax=Fusarium oxysporum f. sp. vasinfectum 25433 TaxID=1089449 RepID=X0KPU3_FUSOX|nr:hypothetical protein FOTG_16084 [Fusarium oxysporum f. sp. vasinfectum 25433]KAK2667155.1 hypothetical protein RAB80_017576 [Fusarium oxysporum f. sp. vasinfectum]KAK2922713.1 hypothetical protein FoTM2_017566 [Fusarium oxysporum f. sp. vasinfectum]
MSSTQVGAMPPPDGVTPDFSGGIGSTYLQSTLIIVYSVTFALATITMILRIYTAGWVAKKLSWDSPLIVLAWGISLAFFITSVKAMPSGFGKHLWNVTIVDLEGYLNLLLVLALTYIWPPTLSKLAILVLYHRIIPNRPFRIAVYLTAVSVTAYTVVFTALFIGPCNPSKTGSGVCLNNISIAQAVLNIITDAVLIILPIPVVHRLQMPLKQRATIGALLSLGSGVILASCVRIGYVRKMQNNPDVTWTQASAAVWSSVELNIGIVCNCLATLKPFVRQHLPRLAGLVGGSTSSKNSNQAASGNRFNSWRGDKASYGYELHSVDRPKKAHAGVPGHSRDIIVVDEFQVQYGNAQDKGDASSTENILESDIHRKHRGERPGRLAI